MNFFPEMKELVVSRYFPHNIQLVEKITQNREEIQTIYASRTSPAHFFSNTKQKEDYSDKKTTNCIASVISVTSNHSQATENVLKNNKRQHNILLQPKDGFLGFRKCEMDFSSNKSRILYAISTTKKYGMYKQKNPLQEYYSKTSSNPNIKYKHHSKYFFKFIRSSGSLEGIIKQGGIKKYQNSNYLYKNYKTKTALKLEKNDRQMEFVNPETKPFYMLDQPKFTLININFEREYFRNWNSVPANNLENTPIFVPPKSPYNLIEEVLYHDPWALLAATIFLNKTSCKVARPYIFCFLVENPDPLSVVNLFPKELVKYFDNLGLTNTRAVQIWRMSYDYLYKEWKKPTELYGIGNYGECAYNIFCLGDFNVNPKDKHLKKYKDWYEKTL